MFIYTYTYTNLISILPSFVWLAPGWTEKAQHS